MTKSQRIARSRKGGYTRAAKLSPQRRQEIARAAIRARWARAQALSTRDVGVGAVGE
jgi:hypothetical protein